MEKKHSFTITEKKEFLKIVRKYGRLIDGKACDSNSLRRKTIAWNRIACEYNTSAISPYPATSKQLRRFWMNLKQREKLTIEKLEKEIPASEDFPSGSSQVPEVEEESIPYFVNIDNTESADDNSKTQFSDGSYQEDDSVFNTTESNGRTFNIVINEEEESFKTDNQGLNFSLETEGSQLKRSLLLKEFQDRRQREAELHVLRKRLVMEQIREARAKANLAELELRQQQSMS